MNLASTIELYCGGPGSGRHPGYGKFNTLNQTGYKFPKGSGTIHNWHHPGTGTSVKHWIPDDSAKQHRITEQSPGKGQRQQFTGDKVGAQKFLSDRYGID